MRKTFGRLLFFPLLAGALLAQDQLQVNGRTTHKPPIYKDGEVYVAVSDLKAAGAQVTRLNGKLSIHFLPAEGGANQVQAVEGSPGEWLFNGIWRVKVGSVQPIVKPYSGDPGTPGWSVDVEIRNGAKKEVALQQTGVKLPTMAVEGGTVLKADEGDWQTICFRSLLPGAAVTHSLKFYFPHGTTKAAAPQRLVVPVDTAFGLLRDTGLRYSVAAPAFRVDLSR